MKRFFSAVIALLLCFLPCAAPARAVDLDSPVRVGLVYGTAALTAVQLESSDGAGFSLGRFNGVTFVPELTVADTSLTLTCTADGGVTAANAGTGAVLYTSAAGQSLAVRPAGTLTRFEGNHYYGAFLCRPEVSGRLSVINYVELEDYVKGVLPYEMSASWSREALKAQAICARSYALTNLDKHASLGFDLCNTTNCQVYRGTGRATANSDAAADETAGQYLIANGKPATGFFFSSDGGATESNENVWGGDPISYLRGVRDPYENSASALNGSWSVTMTAAQVTAKLQSAGYSIGTAASVTVTQRTDMDNVNQVTVTDTAGKSITLRNSAVRTAFGLNSIRYTVSATTGSGAAGGNALSINGTASADSGLYAIGGDGAVQRIDSVTGRTVLTGSGTQTISASGGSTIPAAASFTFTGTGWGHNVGMSQYGAKAMAEQGFTCEEILKFYFTGIEIAG